MDDTCIPQPLSEPYTLETNACEVADCGLA